ncbi:MAG: ketol-acid reductoisomerase, partial [Gammaproteobacteria bacterium]
YEMNKVISDTAEYGCYLFSHAAVPMLKTFMAKVDTDIIGKGLNVKDNNVDDRELIAVNAAIRNHPIEKIGQSLRGHMTDMKKVV